MAIGPSNPDKYAAQQIKFDAAMKRIGDVPEKVGHFSSSQINIAFKRLDNSERNIANIFINKNKHSDLKKYSDAEIKNFLDRISTVSNQKLTKHEIIKNKINYIMSSLSETFGKFFRFNPEKRISTNELESSYNKEHYNQSQINAGYILQNDKWVKKESDKKE